MERMTESQYIIQMLEQTLEKLDAIEKRMEVYENKLSNHKTVHHPFRSHGKHYTKQSLLDTKVVGRY